MGLVEIVGPMACSCDYTYVFKSCCGSAPVVVHGAPGLNLGTLQVTNGQDCNLATG